MTRALLLALPLMLGGCVQEFGLWGKCRADTVQGLIGQPLTDRMRHRIRDRTHAFKMRVVHPGEAVTMEMMDNRTTVTLDEREHIAAIRCG